MGCQLIGVRGVSATSSMSDDGPRPSSASTSIVAAQTGVSGYTPGKETRLTRCQVISPSASVSAKSGASQLVIPGGLLVVVAFSAALFA
jgi:hypothetical protein